VDASILIRMEKFMPQLNGYSDMERLKDASMLLLTMLQYNNE
jgi:hypothetical protein